MVIVISSVVFKSFNNLCKTVICITVWLMHKWIQNFKAPSLNIITSLDWPHMRINVDKIDGLRCEEFDQIRSEKEYELQHTHDINSSH